MGATKFSISTSLAQPSDQWIAEVGTSDAFRQAAPGDWISLAVGLLVNGVPAELELITEGPVDAYRLTFDAKGRTTYELKGRDQMAHLLETEYRMTYRNGPAPTVVSGKVTVPERQGLFRASQIAQDIVAAAGLTLAWECPDYLVYQSFSAVGRPIDLLTNLVRPFSQVEARLVDVFLIGTTVHCRQRQLASVVAPANQLSVKGLHIQNIEVRKFLTDRIGSVSLSGRTVHGAISENPSAPTGDPTGAVTLAEGGMLRTLDTGVDIVIPPGSVATPTVETVQGVVAETVVTPAAVRLGTGMVTLPNGDILKLGMPASPPPAVLGGTTTVAATEAAKDPVSGKSLGRTTRLNTYRMPDQLLLREEVQTYVAAPDTGPPDPGLAEIGLIQPPPGTEVLVKKEIKTTQWEDSIYGDTGAANQPLELGEVSEIVQTLPVLHHDALWQLIWIYNIELVTDRTTRSLQYDTLKLLTQEVEMVYGFPFESVPIVEERRQDPLLPKTMTVKTYRDLKPGFYAVNTDVYTWTPNKMPPGYPPDPGPYIPNASPLARWGYHWVRTSGDVTISSGTRPGGIRSGGGAVGGVDAGGGGGDPGQGTEDPGLTWATPADINSITPLDETQLNAKANVPGTFTYTPPAGTTLKGGDQTLRVEFTPQDAARYKSAKAEVKIHVRQLAKGVQKLLWGPIADMYEDEKLSNVQLDCHTQVPNFPGSYAYDPPAGTHLWAGKYNLTCTFHPTDTANWDDSSAKNKVTVLPGRIVPRADWATPAPISEGVALSATQLNAVFRDGTNQPPGGGMGPVVPGTIKYTPGIGTVLHPRGAHQPSSPIVDGPLAPNEFYLNAEFTPDTPDTPNRYAPATARVTIQIIGAGKGVVDIQWRNPSDIREGEPLTDQQLDAKAVERTTLNAVAGVLAYTPASGTVLLPGEHILTVTFTPADPVTYANEQAQVTLTVKPKDGRDGGPAPGDGKLIPAITWATPEPIVKGTPLSSTQLNATCDVPGSFEYVPPAGVVLSGGDHTLSCTFRPADSATYDIATDRVHLYVTGPTAPKKPSIDWHPEPLDFGQPLGPAQLNATASDPDTGAPVAGAFEYSPAAGQVLTRGFHHLAVSFEPTDDATYQHVQDAVSFAPTEAPDPLPGPGPGDGTNDQVESVEGVVDPDPTAPALSFSDANLELATLRQIYQQIAECSQLWQFEVSFTGVNVAWLRRGDVIRITDLVDSEGQPIALPPLLVQQFRLDYDESARPPSLSRQIRCLGWMKRS